MKILVVAWQVDAANLAIENIVREMKKRDHYVEIYSFSVEYKEIWMFEDLDIPIYDVRELSSQVVKKFDVAFTVDLAMRALRCQDIYVFSYNYITDTWISEGSDFMFTMVKDRNLKWHEDCATMSIGSAKNDRPLLEEKVTNQILYIDAGHNPFGWRGKQQVANMLLKICDKFPDYTVLVKPRWFPDDIKNQPHLSRIHIYEVLKEITKNEIPSNLSLINEYTNLQDLIDESVCVITTSVSCYLDVALRGKGCIVVKGLDSDEAYDSRTAFNNVYRAAEESGCCVNYYDVVDYLPCGIRCSEEHLNNRIACRDNVSARIMDVMEYVYTTFLSKDTYPAIKQYNYENYKEELCSDVNISMTELKYRRFKNGAMIITRLFEWMQNDGIDYSEWFRKLEGIYRTFSLNEEGFRQLIGEMDCERKGLILKNKGKLMDDPINQSLLLQAMYDTGNKDDILLLEKESILCMGPYNYYMGRIYSENPLSKKAIEYYKDYLMESNKRSYAKYIQEEFGNKRIAYNYVFSKWEDSDLTEEEIGELCVSLRKTDVTLVNYDLRKKMRDCIPQIAEKIRPQNADLSWELLKLYAETENHYYTRELKDQIKTLINQNYNTQRSPSYRIGRMILFPIRIIRNGIKRIQNVIHKESGYSLKERIKGNNLFRIFVVFNNLVLSGFEIYKQIVNLYGNNIDILLSAISRGDTYIIGSYYQEYIKRMSMNNPVFVVWKENSKDIAELFGIDRIVVLERAEFESLINLLMFNYTGIIPIYSMHYHAFYRHTAINGYLMGINGLNLNSISAASLDVDEEANAKPIFSYDMKEIDNIFQQNGLIYGKTVVLAPYAKSVFAIQPLFWIELANRLKRLGYSVCTNVVYDEKPIAGTKGVFIPFNLSVAFLERAGATVGLRSGFQDVTSTAKCMKISLIWNNNPNPYVHCTNYDAFNLKEMYGEDNQIDYEYCDDIEEELIDQIVYDIIQYSDSQKVV